MLYLVNLRSVTKRCLYLVNGVMKHGSNVVWRNEEVSGYHSLIQSSIYEKAQLLKDNRHVEHGILVSGQTEFILKEIYSGGIKKRNNESQQYARFAFASANCSSPSENELLCDNCIGVRKILRRLCRNRFLYNNKPLHKFTNTSQIVKSTPTKAMEKIETIGDHLHLVQKSKRYYRMIFEEQREKDGISIDINKCGILFDKEADAEAERIFSSRGETNANKDLLSRLL